MCQLQQIPDAEEAASSSHDDIGIWSDEVCPFAQNAANEIFADLKKYSGAVAVKAFSYTDQPAAAEWMERMHDPHKKGPTFRTGRNMR